MEPVSHHTQLRARRLKIVQRESMIRQSMGLGAGMTPATERPSLATEHASLLAAQRGGAGAPQGATAFTGGGGGRGLHSFALELNLSNPRTRSWAKVGYTVVGRAQVELNWERV
jgi:hypothetical protein